MTKNHIPSLNGLRAISILMVVTSHLYRHNFFPDNFLVRAIRLWVFNGALGVNVFFIISGFLITTLLINENEKNNKISLKNFYLRRTIRIFPAYYFLLAVYFVLQIFGLLHFSATNWFANITYTKQFFPDIDNESGHLWSLSVEEVFYLIWPIVFIKSKNNSTAVVLFLIALTTVTRLFHYDYPSPQYVNTIYSTADSLLIGCLFAINYTKVTAFVIKMKNWNILLIPLLMLSVFIFARLLYYSSANIGNIPKHSLYILQTISYGFLGNVGLFTNVIIGLLIIYCINVKNIWFNILNSRVMEYIGKLSYSIYLWQQLFTQDKPAFHEIPLLVLLLFIFMAACFSYYAIEKPFLLLKKKYSAF